jgi:energy-coupling factor transport system ATP-binding protein
MLEFNHVYFSYGETEILNDLSFSLEEGTLTALLGENGAGKSTAARLCNGLRKPARGTVTVCGRDTSRFRASEIARDVGFLFQNPDRQICQTSVRAEIAFALDLVEGDEGERAKRVDEMLALFGLDGDAAPFDLSRGERQKVALASVLARKPRFLVLDEPTTGLDDRECAEVMGAVKRLQRDEGTTVLMITHDLDIAGEYADSIMTLARGRLVEEAYERAA